MQSPRMTYFSMKYSASIFPHTRKELKQAIFKKNFQHLVILVQAWRNIILFINTLSNKLHANFNKTNVVNSQTHLLMCALVAGLFRPFSLCLRTFYRSLSVTWSVALQIAWNKRKFLHVKKSSIFRFFCTQTWRRFIVLYTNMATVTTCEKDLSSRIDFNFRTDD